MKAILPTFLLLLASLAAPGWEQSVTTLRPGPHLQAAPMHLSFQVSWDGKINAASVDFVWGKPDPRYPHLHIAQLYGSSTGPARALFPYSYNFSSFVRKDDYRPVAFSASEEDRDERRETTNYFGPPVRSTEVTKPFDTAKRNKVKKGTFQFDRAPVHDLLSAFLYVRSLDLKIDQEVTLVLHPFAGPYLARVKAQRREVHRGINCLKLDLELQKIDPKGKLIAYEKMKTATMWLSDDRERLPIELRSEVFIGDVRAILVGKKYL